MAEHERRRVKRVIEASDRRPSGHVTAMKSRRSPIDSAIVTPSVIDSAGAARVKEIPADEHRVSATSNRYIASMTNEAMNADELAVFLSVNRKTVYEYAARGVIPHARLGRRIIFSRAQVEMWLGGHEPEEGAIVGAERDMDSAARGGGGAETIRSASAMNGVTFAEFADEFMQTYVRSNNKPSVRKNKDMILARHLLPAFGRMKLEEIRVHDIERLKASLLDGERSRKTVNNVLACLAKILRYAQETEVIERAPRVRLLKVERPKYRFLDFQEYDALVVASKPEADWHVAILLGGDAGLRLGEIRALRWEDVDLKTDRLTISRAFWQDTEGTTKGWKLRTVPLTKRLGLALKALAQTRGCHVLADSNGQPFNLEKTRWNLPRLCRTAGISTIGWHALRHTFCSHLALRGAPARVIQELAGHSSLSTTLNYMHLVPGATDRAIALLNDGQVDSWFGPSPETGC